MNDTLASPDTLRNLAEWLEKNGLDGAFISLALVLLFVYFMRQILKPSNEEMLQEIKVLLREIKILLTGGKEK
jgi:hypothetical protein